MFFSAVKRYFKNAALNDILNIKKDSNPEDIKKSFISLVKQYHPDKDPTYAEYFTQVTIAYEILSNPLKKAEYDQYYKENSPQSGDNFDSDDDTKYDDRYFSSKAYSNSFNFKKKNNYYSSNFNDSDFAYKSKSYTKIKKPDLEIIVNLTFEESLAGCEKEVIIDKDVKCTFCFGTRCEPETMPSRCWTCGGNGRIPSKNLFEKDKVCGNCEGSGTEIKYPCMGCKGKGYIRSQVYESIHFEKGLRPNYKLVKRAKGHENFAGGINGDLVITLQIEPKENYKRELNTIYYTQNINLWDAALGGEIEVDTILFGNKKVAFNGGIQDGETKTLPGLGAYNSGTGAYGNFTVIFKITNNKEINSKLIDYFKKLSKLESNNIVD